VTSAHDMATVYARFIAQAQRSPNAPALLTKTDTWLYSNLQRRVERCALKLREFGITRGMRVAVLSENCPEYTVLQLAAAKLGALVACLNWRFADDELRDSCATVEPHVLAHSARFAAAAERVFAVKGAQKPLAELCADEGELDAAPSDAQPEDGFLIIFTSGTTGRPRAAVVSQRAEVARMELLRRDLGLDASDAYVAWSPMFHMGGSEHTLASLMYGAAVVICDGLDVATIANTLRTRKVGWLLLVPATIEPLLTELARSSGPIVGVKVVGCMADLVPAATIAALCQVVDAPFLNSFGSTETGLPPLSGDLLVVGDSLVDLSKRRNSGCELRLVDASANDVADGEVGEAWVRGDTLFSGYWRSGRIDRSCFKDGWYPMGDLFVRRPDQRYHYVGRSKYLIKSGGENIYPAEIERVLLDDPRIADAAVIRQPDPTWGEVPVAFIVRNTDGLSAADVEELCRANLASYKRPKSVHFIAAEAMPRSATGKIVREQLEQWVRVATPAEQ
jgi:acyl-CoA synthetase (AMP-forming)/AMP-acid ligase II